MSGYGPRSDQRTPRRVPGTRRRSAMPAASSARRLVKTLELALSSSPASSSLVRASAEEAYTLVGRIPFLNGKIPSARLVIMVRDDPRLRRPYVVVVARAGENDARHAAAVQLAAFLRSPPTQRWIAQFGRGELDDRPLFFPVAVGPAAGSAK